METTQLERRSAAASKLGERRSDLDSQRTVASLCEGLDLVADLLFNRIDRDVEQRFGMDSMLMPATTMGEIQAASRARRLIDIYTSVVAAEEASDQQYVDDRDWFNRWLLELRLDEPDESKAAQRVAMYRDMKPDERRLKFASSLERRMPHATKAPLVTYRLYPLSARIVVAIAFGDNLRASELRNQQLTLLPVIADCHECHGHPLDNGERCHICSNPLWSYDWLTAAD